MSAANNAGGDNSTTGAANSSGSGAAGNASGSSATTPKLSTTERVTKSKSLFLLLVLMHFRRPYTIDINSYRQIQSRLNMSLIYSENYGRTSSLKELEAWFLSQLRQKWPSSTLFGFTMAWTGRYLPDTWHCAEITTPTDFEHLKKLVPPSLYSS